MKSSLSDRKKILRKKQIILRKKIFSNINKSFNKKLFEIFFKEINFLSLKIISSFNSINSEIDTRLLNNYILNKNKTLCFPVILNKGEPLIFRKFIKKQDMVEGLMKIKVPPITNEILVPELIFVPCLAFDSLGFRLGYGGGYYDRTFAHLKKNDKKFISVGYAFEGQKVSEVIKDKFDIKLDYVITDKKIYSFV